MTTQHTPGPWIADSEEMITHGNERIAADVGDHNARLIAAAPDLLASCQALLTCLERDRIENVFITEARAAIAKATG